MKVLVTFEYPFNTTSYGGGNQATRGLSKALSRLGHEVHIVCAGDDELGVARADAPVTYHFTRRYRSQTTGFHTGRLALDIASRLRPDLVVCMTSEAALVVPAARSIGAKAVVYIGTPRLAPFGQMSLRLPRDIRHGLGWFLQFVGAHMATHVATVSHSLVREARHQWRLPPDKVSFVGLGMDDAILAADVVPAAPVPASGPRLLTVGRIVHEQKPVDVLAEGLAAVRKPWSHWTIIGAGVDEAALRDRVTALGLQDRTTLCGMQLPSRVREAMDAAHIVLLPSRYEGRFTTAYEAVSRGRILITNDVNDVRLSFGDTRSVLVADQGSPEAYRVLIERAIQDYDTLGASALAAAASVRATETWEMAARRLLDAATGVRAA